MSHSAQRRFEANIDVDEDEKDGGDPDRNEVIPRRGEEKQKNNYRKLVLGYQKGIKRAKKVVLFPVRRLQKLYRRSRSNNSSSGSGSSSLNYRTANFYSSSKRGGGGSRSSNNYCCCFRVCISKPQTMDSDIDGAEKSDDPELSYEFMKDLIEKNDFYSKECNTHIIDD